MIEKGMGIEILYRLIGLNDMAVPGKSLRQKQNSRLIVQERPKFYLGYPIAKLKWLE